MVSDRHFGRRDPPTCDGNVVARVYAGRSKLAAGITCPPFGVFVVTGVLTGSTQPGVLLEPGYSWGATKGGLGIRANAMVKYPRKAEERR